MPRVQQRLAQVPPVAAQPRLRAWRQSRARRFSHCRPRHRRSRRQQRRRSECLPGHVERSARRFPSGVPAAIASTRALRAEHPIRNRSRCSMCSFGDNVWPERPCKHRCMVLPTSDVVIAMAGRRECPSMIARDHCALRGIIAAAALATAEPVSYVRAALVSVVQALDRAGWRASPTHPVDLPRARRCRAQQAAERYHSVVLTAGKRRGACYAPGVRVRAGATVIVALMLGDTSRTTPACRPKRAWCRSSPDSGSW